jgi:hypothetical protein
MLLLRSSPSVARDFGLPLTDIGRGADVRLRRLPLWFERTRMQRGEINRR